MHKFVVCSLMCTTVFFTSCTFGKEDTSIPSPLPEKKEVIESNVQKSPVIESTPTSEKKKSSMVALFKEGKPLTCTYKTTDEGVEIQGTAYFEGKKMFAISKGMVEGKPIEMNMLVRDEFTYSWGNMTPGTGYKMREVPGNEAKANEEIDSGKDMNEEQDFNCSSGVPSGIFEIPTNVQFQEFSIPVMPK